MKRHGSFFVLAGTLAGCALLILGCGGITGTKVEVKHEISSQNSGGPIVSYRPSTLLNQPVYVTDAALWQGIQNTLGHKMEDVDFDKNTIIGCFAIEPDVQKDAEGKFKDRGYGVWLSSITKDSDNSFTVRFKRKSAPNPLSARGPLHFYFGVVEGKLKNPVYYLNGEKFEFQAEQSFLRQDGIEKQLKDTYLGK